MTELLKRLLGKPRRRAFVQGMGSVLDLGGSGEHPQIMVFHAQPAGQQVRNAWKAAMGASVSEVPTKGHK